MNLLALVLRKLPKAQVHYGRGHVPTICGRCLHLMASQTECRQVEGEVKPFGWCDLWTPRVKGMGTKQS